MVRISEVAAHYGVSTSTIRRWIDRGLIKEAGRTFGGHRRFESADFDSTNEHNAVRKSIGYARVSSYDQKEDLSRQIDRLKDAGCDEVISDIGSGLNCGKPGLRQLLRRLLDNEIHTPATMGTIGGLQTNEKFQVLRPDGSVIKGLYAGGETANRSFYRRVYTSGTGLGLVYTSGRIAGANAAKEK